MNLLVEQFLDSSKGAQEAIISRHHQLMLRPGTGNYRKSEFWIWNQFRNLKPRPDTAGCRLCTEFRIATMDVDPPFVRQLSHYKC